VRGIHHQSFGDRYSLTTSKQSQLQGKCKDTVDRMTDNRHEVEEDIDQYLEKKIGHTPEEEEEAKKFCASQNTKRSCEGGGIHKGGVVCLWFSHREKDQCVFNSLVGDLYPGWSSSDEDDEKAKQKCAEHLFDSTCSGYGCYWVPIDNEYGGQCTFEPDADEDEEGTFLEYKHTPQCEGRMDTKQDCVDFCRKDKGHWGWHWSYNRDCYTCKCDDGTKCKTLRK